MSRESSLTRNFRYKSALARPSQQRGMLMLGRMAGYWARRAAAAGGGVGAQNAADFDGSSDYLTATSFTGQADSKSGIISFWFKLNITGPEDGFDGGYVINGFTGTFDAFQIQYFESAAKPGAGADLNITLKSTGGTTRLDMQSIAGYSITTWHHCLMSWDVNVSASHLYIDNVSDKSINAGPTNTTINLAAINEWKVAAYRTGNLQLFSGCMYDFYFAPGQFLDFSSAANREKFISNGLPVSLGSDGATPTGTTPLIFLHLANAETPNNFATNRAAKGDLTVNGSLATCATSPSDAALVSGPGTLFGWGSGASGGRDNSTTTNASSPVQIASGNSFKMVATSGDATNAIKADGTLWGWGSTSSGKLGNGTTTPNLSSPVQIGSSSWRYVARSNNARGAAIRVDGLLFTWGDGTSGALGDGTAVGKSSPVQIGSLSWTMVVMTSDVTAAIRSDGLLFTWGDGTNGNLGDGTTVSKSSPVQIGSSSWICVAVGTNGGCFGIKADGTLWAWGALSFNGDGAGGTTNRSSPVQIGTSTYLSVVTRDQGAAAIRSDGKLMAWGSNGNGEIGDGTTTIRSSMVQIGSLNWSKLGVGSKNGMAAIRSDGLLFTWGDGGAGELGDSTSLPKSSPVQIGSSSWILVTNDTNRHGIKVVPGS